MIERLLVWGWNRLRPREGWLPFFLLMALATLLVLAVEDARWVSRDHLVRWTAVTGFLLGFALAKRPWPRLASGLALMLVLALVTYIVVSETQPLLLLAGWRPFYLDARLQYFELKLRFLRWLLAVMMGATSRDPLIFLLLLTWGTGLLTAALPWGTYRARQPLPWLLVSSIFLAASSYFAQAGMAYLAGFVALSIFHTAVMGHAYATQRWDTAALGYSGEIRMATWLWGGGVAVSLLLLALVVPSVRITPLVRTFQTSAPVQRLEAELERVFGGVRQPEREPFRPGTGTAPATVSSGVFPRDFLLGDSPELNNTAVFSAIVTPTLRSVGYPYWRGQSYDLYTGTGWAISAEDETALPTAAPLLPADAIAEQPITLTQTITWLLPSQPILLYAAGLPLQMDLPTKRYTRSAVAGDFSRLLVGVPAEPRRVYTAVSSLPQASPAQLRRAAPEAIPPDLHAHYTQLPDDLPGRVPALAQEITAGLDNPYDQARALEQFLRQYEYDLDVPLPPTSVDPVDYFLFELQRGYCDYYASSMIVLARSLGLPARMGVGYRVALDATRPATVRQNNGHSWAEIYFAGHGWVAFEPTAAYPRSVPLEEEQVAQDLSLANREADEDLYPRTTLPPRTTAEPVRQTWWERYRLAVGAALLSLALLLGVGGWLWWRQRDRVWQTNEVEQSYGRLQRMATRLAARPVPSQTPHEFGARLQAKLAAWPLPEIVPTAVERLVALYNRRLYAPPTTADEQGRENELARRLWRTVRRPLWLTRLRYLVQRVRHRLTQR